MRYYLGVDWADQTHAIWVVDEHGTKVAGRTVVPVRNSIRLDLTDFA